MKNFLIFIIFVNFSFFKCDDGAKVTVIGNDGQFDKVTTFSDGVTRVEIREMHFAQAIPFDPFGMGGGAVNINELFARAGPMSGIIIKGSKSGKRNLNREGGHAHPFKVIQGKYY